MKMGVKLVFAVLLPLVSISCQHVLSEPPVRSQAATSQPPESEDGPSVAFSERLDQSLRKGMSIKEAYSAIGARASAGGPCGVLWSFSRVISDEYPGVAIDLYFRSERPGVNELTDWQIVERQAVDYFMPL
jgi:hypothetical protein